MSGDENKLKKYRFPETLTNQSRWFGLPLDELIPAAVCIGWGITTSKYLFAIMMRALSGVAFTATLPVEVLMKSAPALMEISDALRISASSFSSPVSMITFSSTFAAAQASSRLIILFSRPHFEAAFCALFKICDHCVIFTKATLFINQVEHPAYGKSRNSFQRG